MNEQTKKRLSELPPPNTEAEREAILTRYAKAEKPLLDELAAVGLRVETAWDLRSLTSPYPKAIPILLNHLDRAYPSLVKEGIALAAGPKWARSLAWDSFVGAYSREPNLSPIHEPGEMGAPAAFKDGLACGLSAMARPDDLDTIIALVTTPRHGPSRIFFIRNLSRSKMHRAFETLVRMRNDPDLCVEIEYRLRAKLRRAAKREKPVH